MKLKYLLNDFIWNIKRRIKVFRNKKINIVFVCHRPALWGSLKSFFEACNEDKRFNITIVAIPNKKQLPGTDFNHQVYESEGAEVFFKNFPCAVIEGYDYKNGIWFDLKKLNIDYIFFQTPYNICRPEEYHSKVVSQYAKICYVHYAANMMGNEIYDESYPFNFIKDVSFFFCQSDYDFELHVAHLKKVKTKIKRKIFITGFPRYDSLEKYKKCDSDLWSRRKENDICRIIWTPRWSTRENNCHFFDYKDKILDYIDSNNEIDFIFRPHPQAFLEWNANGELNEEDAEKYKNEYIKRKNAKIDSSGEYLHTFYSSDILITDISSIIAEYFLTGKPIIYCHKTDHFNDFSRKMSQGFYWVSNWEELSKTLDFLKKGIDPLKAKREDIINELFPNSEKKACCEIKEIIIKDFFR